MPQQNSFDELSNTAPRWQVCIRCETLLRGAASWKVDVQRDQAEGFVLVEVCMPVLSASALDVRVAGRHLVPLTGLVFGGKACPGLCPVTMGSPRVVRRGWFCVAAKPRHAVNKLLLWSLTAGNISSAIFGPLATTALRRTPRRRRSW